MDDMFTFIKEENITEVINVLNSFHRDINFTHEVEENNCISFLDVKVIRNENGLLSREVFLQGHRYQFIFTLEIICTGYLEDWHLGLIKRELNT